MFLGVDPSYTRTGLSLLDESQGVVLASTSVSIPQLFRGGSVYSYRVAFPVSLLHAHQCFSWVEEMGFKDDISTICMEMPAYSTMVGVHLLPLQCLFYAYTRMQSFCSNTPFYLIPPSAINSLVLPKRGKRGKGSMSKESSELFMDVEVPEGGFSTPQKKKLIVSWVSGTYGVDVNHDEASSIVLAHIGRLIMAGQYTGSYERLDDSKFWHRVLSGESLESVLR